MQKVLGTVRKAVKEYRMIKENDKIAVGVSGGKDSVVLLKALGLLKGFYPERFEVIAITVDPHFEGDEGDYGRIEALCKELGIEYYVEKTEIWDIVFKTRGESNPCSLCSRMRKGALYEAAIKLGCNKVALGHHLDDAAVTFYMSLLKNGTIGCFSPVTRVEEKGIEVIRPLVLTRERDIVGVAKSLPVIKSRCSENGCTERHDVAETLAALQKQYGDVKEKTVGAMRRSKLCGW